MKKLLKKCLCGGKPRLKKRKMEKDLFYYFYTCQNKKCIYPLTTFATRKEEFCRELWNSTIDNRLKNV